MRKRLTSSSGLDTIRASLHGAAAPRSLTIKSRKTVDAKSKVERVLVDQTEHSSGYNWRV